MPYMVIPSRAGQGAVFACLVRPIVINLSYESDPAARVHRVGEPFNPSNVA